MFNRFKGTTLGRLLIALVIVAALLFAIKAITEWVTERPDGSKYQAVALINGQLYFGKLSGLDGDFVTLKDVYLAQSQNTTASQGPSPQPQARFTISGLDQNSILKPEQEMTIIKSSIIYWENMQDDAEVVKKINELKKK